MPDDDPGLPWAVCEALTSARRAHGWTLHAAGSLAGISAPYLCRIEGGTRTPCPHVAVALIEAYDLIGHVRAPLIDAVEDRHGSLPDQHEHLRPVPVAHLHTSSGVQHRSTPPRPALPPPPPPPQLPDVPWWRVDDDFEL